MVRPTAARQDRGMWMRRLVSQLDDVTELLEALGRMLIVIDAKLESGAVESWKGEGPAPVFFRSRDTDKSEFDKAVGKTMTIEVSRARDGSHSGLLRNITMPDGKMISLCPQNC